MGFKTMTSYNDEKYGNFFRLQNDGDYADVVFMYRSTDDVMMADTHYIKSNTYSGYVLCCGDSCPACNKQVRIQPKLFIPLYVISTNEPSGITGRIQFWDRTMRFQPQLVNDVFRSYPNPSEFIFRITRHGAAGDINTSYDIRAIQSNNDPTTSYDGICARFNAVFPDYFNTVCRDLNVFELGTLMSDTSASSNVNTYDAVPRGSSISDPSVAAFTGNIPGTGIPFTNNEPPAMSNIPMVDLDTTIPNTAPSMDGTVSESSSVDSEVDPLQTDEDIDITNLNF